MSAPRATILSASSGNGLCSAFASSHVSEKSTNLEDAQTEIADQKLRKETAAAILRISKTVVEAGAVFDIATVKLIAATQPGPPILWMLQRSGLFDERESRSAGRNRIDRTNPERSRRANDCRNGKGPSSNAGTDRTAKPNVRAASTNDAATLLTLQHLAWYDSDADKHRAPSKHDSELPLHLIGKARTLGAAHDLKSDVRAKNHGSKTSAPPDWNHVKWLNDNPKAKSNVEPIRHSAFEPHPNVPAPHRHDARAGAMVATFRADQEIRTHKMNLQFFWGCPQSRRVIGLTPRKIDKRTFETVLCRGNLIERPFGFERLRIGQASINIDRMKNSCVPN